jgi:hypothetical protein
VAVGVAGTVGVAVEVSDAAGVTVGVAGTVGVAVGVSDAAGVTVGVAGTMGVAVGVGFDVPEPGAGVSVRACCAATGGTSCIGRRRYDPKTARNSAVTQMERDSPVRGVSGIVLTGDQIHCLYLFVSIPAYVAIGRSEPSSAWPTRRRNRTFPLMPRSPFPRL